jgi:hypothetical protein
MFSRLVRVIAVDPAGMLMKSPSRPTRTWP